MDTSNLPIRQYAADILAAVAKNDVVVVIGETGSGKTTQLSQVISQAAAAAGGAVTVARRVAEERRVELGGEVGYAVRFENRASSSTKIKYLTDGTLLQECLEDTHLTKYQVVILDEAHERSLNTDILFGVIKKLLSSQEGARQHRLKLLVTSATLDGEKFSAYFNDCPVFNVPGRCFPVDIIHSQDDHMQDYAAAAVDTALQIHLQQPPGDILIFLTGQAEIDKAVQRLNREICNLPEGSAGDLLVLPLYAALPPELQLRVFRPAQPAVRRCIVATNVAETSITVEGVVYVIDSGVMKLKSYNAASGMDSLEVTAISRVQAAQRAGRAGRTRPGKCFRLYTRSYFERQMPDVTPPEICRTSLAGAVLGLKALGLPGLDVLSFDFLDPPEQASLCEALRQLYVLDALDIDGGITPTGKAMAGLPLEPALARALLEARKLGCLEEVVTVAAMLSAEHVFAAGQGPESRAAANALTSTAPPGSSAAAQADAGRKLKQLAEECQGDHLLLLRLYQMWAAAGFTRDFVKAYGLELRGMNFARDIRKQLAVGFANRIARRMRLHNGYRTCNQKGALAQVHPGSSQLCSDDDGLLPEWLIYHEFVATSRPFLRQVCPTRHEWVEPLLPKLQDVDVQRLSGGKLRAQAAAAAAAAAADSAADEAGTAADGEAGGQKVARRNDDDAVNAARQRYLQRKQAAVAGKKK
ncbi:DEAH-box nuclear pre-mRNA splicing factor [Scenedesmus sp. NREL 46B-D3]|nr:DEAH-box nuclear pre-mRNA splicing factor [Scenedesmus sp. NREL 46B-D3]